MRTPPKNSNRKLSPPWKNRRPALRFSPWAWAKLLRLRDLGPTEVGGFGISDAEDLLLIEDFVLIQQNCSPVTVAFDDDAVAEYFDHQIDLGRRPAQVGRVWIHTHPGTSSQPSRVFTVTGSFVAFTTALMMDSIFFKSLSKPAPSPRVEIFRTQHPQLISIKSG